jgi:dihydrofolate synthase/folylpolyglutamate synthase
MHRTVGAGSLADWLSRLERRGPAPIALGLERIAAVDARLRKSGIDRPIARSVLTVAGTNGKGSVVAYADSMLRAGGLRVGRYTSPHLLVFNERIVIDGVMVSDEALVGAFERIDQARGEIDLTYFEFTTLAAFELFRASNLDVAVLEVGLGGRLDAVNLIDADVAVITSIGLDHQEYLGPDRDSIGFEKAGVARSGKPLVLAEPDPPARLLEEAHKREALLYQVTTDFGWRPEPAAEAEGRVGSWRRYYGPHDEGLPLPAPALSGQHQWGNLAAAVTAVRLLPGGARLDAASLRAGIQAARLAGRLQRIEAPVPAWLDVAHNPHGAVALASWLKGCPQPRHAVFGLLADKDLDGVLAPLLAQIECWHPVQLGGPRAMPVEALAAALCAAGARVQMQGDRGPQRVWKAAMRLAVEQGGSLIGFGSFLLVTDVLGEGWGLHPH